MENHLSKSDVECLWHEFDKNVSEHTLHSYHKVFKMAAMYAVIMESLQKVVSRIRGN